MFEKAVTVGLGAFLFVMLLVVTFLHGKHEERFNRTWVCTDCGDVSEDLEHGMCYDCRRKLYGEMRQG